MSAAVHTQAVLMLRAPWQWLRNDGRGWAALVYAALAGLLVGVLLLALMFWGSGGLAKILLGVFAAIGLLAAWALQFSALLRLDHPHAARFVVGHGRALRAAALGLWLGMVAFVAVVALVAALALGQPGGSQAPALVAAMMAGAALLFTAMALRWRWLWVMLFLPFPVFDQPAVRAALAPVVAFVQAHWQAQPVMWTLLTLLAMAAGLAELFGKGDSAHARAYARRENLRKIASDVAVGQKPILAAYGRWGEVLGAPFQSLVDAWLAHVIHRASPKRGSVMARAELVLHGAHHWVREVPGAVMGQLVGLAALILLSRWASGHSAALTEGGYVGLSIGLAIMAIAPLLTLPRALWFSRREQALLLLLPGMPRGTALNQALARQQLKHYLLTWSAVLPAFAAVAYWGQAAHGWAFVGAALPMSALLWRDASRLRAPGSVMVLAPYLLTLALGLAFMLFLRWHPAMLLPWAVGVVLLTSALLAWRWRKLSQWPQALPAGRLA